jgi:hypothetical protein
MTSPACQHSTSPRPGVFQIPPRIVRFRHWSAHPPCGILQVSSALRSTGTRSGKCTRRRTLSAQTTSAEAALIRDTALADQKKRSTQSRVTFRHRHPTRQRPSYCQHRTRDIPGDALATSLSYTHLTLTLLGAEDCAIGYTAGEYVADGGSMRRLMSLMLACSTLVSCGTPPPAAPLAQQIVGTWRQDDSAKELTFTADGYRPESIGFGAGCWRIDEEHDTLALGFPHIDTRIGFGILIENDRLILDRTGNSGRGITAYTRIDDSELLTSEQNESIDLIKDRCADLMR